VADYQNWQLFADDGAFCMVMVCFVASFMLGGRLSVVYPMYASIVLWGALSAVWIEKEVLEGLGWTPLECLCGPGHHLVRPGHHRPRRAAMRSLPQTSWKPQGAGQCAASSPGARGHVNAHPVAWAPGTRPWIRQAHGLWEGPS
jgi:hypothetical protein